MTKTQKALRRTRRRIQRFAKACGLSATYIWRHVMAPFRTGWTWHCNDGRRIKIRDMESSHLLNTLNYFGRRRNYPGVLEHRLYPVMMYEARRRGFNVSETRPEYQPEWLTEKNRTWGRIQRLQDIAPRP